MSYSQHNHKYNRPFPGDL